MGEKMTTGSVGKSAGEVETTKAGGNAESMPDAAEATEDQAKTVDGPSEALSADKDLEGMDK